MSCHGRNRRQVFRVGLCLAFVISASACKLFKSTCDEDDRTCLGGGLGRSGEPCVRSGDCATGMDCRDSRCVYAQTTERGDECVVSAECEATAYCSSELQCSPIVAEPASAGGACGDSSDCEKGLVCDLNLDRAMQHGPFGALSEDCRERAPMLENRRACLLPKTCTRRGNEDFGSDCDTNDDCLAGLYCIQSPLSETEQTSCLGGVELEIEPFTVPIWAGTDCPMDTGIPTAYFEVPFGAGAEHDFYRLPFPNDIRRRNGKVELGDHPMPPESLEPPIAARFIEDAASLDGFSTNPTVYFRFSTALKGGTNISLSTVKIIDITASSPEYNSGPSIAWGPPERESRYICPHWLSIYRPLGTPLRPKTTYAALVTRGVRSKEDEEFQRSPDFDAMLSATKPSDSNLQTAWEVYAPLRAWLDDAKAELDADDLLNASVFTTGEPQRAFTQLADVAQAEAIPAAESLTVCKTGVKSPCEDETGRGACHTGQAGFIEIHGKLSLPIFQRGNAPYELPDEGGDISTDAQGQPRVSRREDVCFALSVPTRAAPAAGYPVVLYAHSLGGVFNEAFDTGGLATELAKGDQPSAVFALELPQHGSRRGASRRPPEDLFLNYQNPAALRGNVLQGAADLLGLIARASAGIPSTAAPSGMAIPLDPARIVLYAHGQGATHAALALAADDRVQAAVLAGVSGHFASTSVTRTKPASTAALLPLLLADPQNDGILPGGLVHPMLSIMQRSLDSADPINYADRLYRIDESRGRDVFLVYGQEDHFTPENAQQAYARAAKLPAAGDDLSGDFRELAAPVRGNVTVGSERHTAALRTYDPEDDPVDPAAVRDGHYVVETSKSARADVLSFIRQALAGETPSIGDPNP